MWVTAVYHQVSLFSLKPSDVTSTGGKSLLVPTPYSIKMALLDRALRADGAAGSALFPMIRDLGVALSPPPALLVNNCFVRIQTLRRPKPVQRKGAAEQERNHQETEGEENEEEGQGPYVRSVAFREYVHYSGPLGIALAVERQEDAEQVQSLLLLVNYFGKRGSFFQIDNIPTIRDDLPRQQGYLLISEEGAMKQQGPGTLLQVLDDMDQKMTFEQVSAYSTTQAVGKERHFHRVALPYQVMRSSHGFTLYQRTDHLK